MGGGCGPGAGSRPGRLGIEPARHGGGPGAGRRGSETPGSKAARGESTWAGFPNTPAESGRQLSGSRGLPFTSLPPQRGPRRSCLRSSRINSRSAFVDTGTSGLPPTHKVSPQVLTCVPFGVLQRGLLLAVHRFRKSHGQGSKCGKPVRGEVGKQPSREAREHGVPPFRPLPSFPKPQGAPGSKPTQKLGAPASPRFRKPRGVGLGGIWCGNARRSGHAASCRRPFARGLRARPRSSSVPARCSCEFACTAPTAAGHPRHRSLRPLLLAHQQWGPDAHPDCGSEAARAPPRTSEGMRNQGETSKNVCFLFLFC